MRQRNIEIATEQLLRCIKELEKCHTNFTNLPALEAAANRVLAFAQGLEFKVEDLPRLITVLRELEKVTAKEHGPISHFAGRVAHEREQELEARANAQADADLREEELKDEPPGGQRAEL